MQSLAPGSASATTAQPLYAIEEHLAILVDTAELVPPDQEQEFREEFQRALTTAVEKRARRTVYQKALDRIESYVSYTIESLGRDARGKNHKLEGKTFTFSLAACPPSVEVIDEAAIPSEYKALTFKLPAMAWAQILNWLDAEQRDVLLKNLSCLEISIDKRAIRAAINGGMKIPGADLAIGNTSLRRS